jgi:hypothetical protein
MLCGHFTRRDETDRFPVFGFLTNYIRFINKMRTYANHQSTYFICATHASDEVKQWV